MWKSVPNLLHLVEAELQFIDRGGYGDPECWRPQIYLSGLADMCEPVWVWPAGWVQKLSADALRSSGNAAGVSTLSPHSAH
jgi:hypothetical protein